VNDSENPFDGGKIFFASLDDSYNLKRMRYPVEQKAKTHQKIIAAAARSFRLSGCESNGIARLMKELGLTHGGFYRHFHSKEDLYAQAVARGFEELSGRMVAAAEGAPRGRELEAMIEQYLSVEHLNDPGTGCVLAALAPEFARQPVRVRTRINESMRGFMERMLRYLPGRDAAQKRGRFFVLFPGMAGVLVTARAIVNPERQEEILAAAKSFYLSAFTRERVG
jgi:TetR/AcrR family transcriptional regulator, transcriptional repressor for nem operon